MQQQEKSPKHDGGCLPISVASLGCGGTIIAAIIGGVFAVISAMAGRGDFSTIPNLNHRTPPSVAKGLTIEIDGPATAILGQRTEYVINSTNAVRLVWTINGYDFDEKNILDNVSPQHEIWVEPTNLSEVGVTFTIQVIAYDANGRSESAEKYFIVASE